MKPAHQGFTLVEMLVAVSLLAVIMVALGSSLRTIAQTEVRVDQRLDRIDEMRVAVGLLRQTVGRVSGRRTPAADAKGGQVVQFRASEATMEWVGIMPARPGVGGRYFFRLAVENSTTGADLVLRFVPWSADAVGTDWKRGDSRVLVRHVAQFRVEAEGRPPAGVPVAEWPRGWVAGWPIADQLPERVRLQITDRDGAWPTTVVNIHPLMQGAGSGGGFALGGSAP